MQDDIDARQAVLVEQAATDEGNEKDGAQTPKIEEAAAYFMRFDRIGQFLLECGACHDADEDIEAEKRQDGEQVIAIYRHGVERSIDVEVNRLECAHEGKIGNTLFVERDHAHADRRRFDDRLDGFVGVSSHDDARSVDIGKDVTALLSFDVLRKPIGDEDDSGGIAVEKGFFGFFGRINGAEDVQIGARFEKRPNRAAHRAIIEVDDVYRYIRHGALPIDRLHDEDARDEHAYHRQKARLSDVDLQKIDESFE